MLADVRDGSKPEILRLTLCFPLFPHKQTSGSPDQRLHLQYETSGISIDHSPARADPSNVWMMFMRPLSIVLGLVAALTGNAVAVAQTWPSRPITLVVPFPPGPAL